MVIFAFALDSLLLRPNPGAEQSVTGSLTTGVSIRGREIE